MLLIMENEEIKIFLKKFAKKTLKKYELFTQIYGEDFVERKLEENIDKVYTDIYNNNLGGSYNRADNTITIYKNDPKIKDLKIKDIKKNKSLQEILLHESIHAIFKRSKEECNEYGIESGTGIEEEYYNSYNVFRRGLNEGLTEWICEKAGYNVQAYHAEVNIVKLLEIAIGEEGILKLAKGDIKGNVSEVLHMEPKRCIGILSEIDNIYLKEDEIRKINNILNILEENKNKFKKDKSLLKNKLGDYYVDYLELMSNCTDLYIGPLSKNKVKSQIQYLKNVMKEKKDDLDNCICWTEDNIFRTYFWEEIKEAQDADYISKEKMQKIKKIYNMLQGERKKSYS